MPYDPDNELIIPIMPSRNTITLSLKYKEAYVYLPNGSRATIDPTNYMLVAPYHWFKNSAGYAVTSTDGKLIGMHRLILLMKGASLFNKVVDHKNCDRLDNRTINLQPITQRRNLERRQYKRKHGVTSRGVWYDPTRRRYCTSIWYETRRVYIGRFRTELEAAKAYDAKARELYGPQAITNYKGD